MLQFYDETKPSPCLIFRSIQRSIQQRQRGQDKEDEGAARRGAQEKVGRVEAACKKHFGRTLSYKKISKFSIQAAAAQKFREQQEIERRKHLEQMRYREQDKLNQVAERRKAIEQADRERKEAMLRKAIERDERIQEKRRAQQSHMSYAFGSSTPRTLHPNLGSTTDIWGGSKRYRPDGCFERHKDSMLISPRSSFEVAQLLPPMWWASPCTHLELRSGTAMTAARTGPRGPPRLRRLIRMVTVSKDQLDLWLKEAISYCQ